MSWNAPGSDDFLSWKDIAIIIAILLLLLAAFCSIVGGFWFFLYTVTSGLRH